LKQRRRGELAVSSASLNAVDVDRLGLLGKPILVIEYTSNPELALSMLREIRELGFVGYVASRDLKTLSPPACGCGQPDCSQ
jgi:hypothetical protein